MITLEIREHTHKHLSPFQLNVTYDADARCPAWETFVDSTFPEDALVVAWEIIAWVMMPNTSIQKALLLLGEGGNGKSTFLTAVETFLGEV